MGDRYFLSLVCPYCQEINYDCCCAPTCDFTTWQCEHCKREFDIEGTFSAEEMAEYVEEQEAHSKMIKALVSGLEPSVPQPVISQLAIAIEETLIVYHEPMFIRWACRALQGLVDKKFKPTEYMDEMSRGWGIVGSWAGYAAKQCAEAARQATPDGLIDNAAIAIEAALLAQDVLTRKNDIVDAHIDAQKEKK